MNKRYYREYNNRKSKWYLVSYSISFKNGTSGFGSIELQISGKPKVYEVRDYIVEESPNCENAVIINMMEMRKVRKLKDAEPVEVEPDVELKVRDRVSIVNDDGNEIGKGTIYNINDFREPNMKYAVNADGYRDVLFFGEDQLIKILQ